MDFTCNPIKVQLLAGDLSIAMLRDPSWDDWGVHAAVGWDDTDLRWLALDADLSGCISLKALGVGPGLGLGLASSVEGRGGKGNLFSRNR